MSLSESKKKNEIFVILKIPRTDTLNSFLKNTKHDILS